MNAPLPHKAPAVRITLLGALGVFHGDEPIKPPASRKTRAIFGYLAMAPRPVSRQRLCDLFFDIPDDPRAALRWSLTKLRPLIDTPGSPRLVAQRDALSLDLRDADVDVADLHRLAAKGEAAWRGDDVDDALARIQGRFLEDADLPDRPDYTAWLTAMRHDLTTLETSLLQARLEQLSAAPDRQIGLLHRWISLDPLSEAAYTRLVSALNATGKREDATTLAASAERALSQAGLKPGPALRAVLRDAVAITSGARDTHLSASHPSTTAADAVKILTPHQPSIGAVPLINHSPDAVHPSWLDGFLEALVHQLARFRAFRVAGLSASLQFKDARIADPQTIAAKLGVRDLVGGSVMVRDGALKLRYRLVDSVDGSVYANGDIDVPMNGMATLLDDAPSELVLRLVHHIVAKSIMRAQAEPTDTRDAHDLVYLGIAAGLLTAPFDYAKALRMFEAALDIAPDMPMALAYASYARGHLGDEAGPDNAGIGRRQALAAIALAGDDAQALAIGGWALLQLGGDLDTALRAVESATRFNPLGRVCWSASAWVRTMAGEYETPMRHWDNAERCNPLGAGIDQTFAGRALCSWMAGKHEEAAAWARRCLERAPNHAAGHLAAVAAAVELGRHEDARAAGAALLAAWPNGLATPVLANVPIRDPETKARLFESIVQALPDMTAPLLNQAATPSSAATTPTVAVIPFQDLSATPLPKHVAAGFFDGLTHALSRFRSLTVVSPASSARYGAHLEDPARIGEALGADILVGGSLMAAGDGRMRLRWRAVDAESGRLLASGDFTGAHADLWDLQEDAAARIAVEVEPRAQAEALRARLAKPTPSRDAYDLYLQGLFTGFSIDGRNYARALSYFEAALSHDPRFHPALAMAPWAAAYANVIATPADLARFAQMSRDALRFGRDDARTQATAGTALLYMAHEFSTARAAVERALFLNPNEYTAWICGGWMHAMKGESDAAHRMFDRAERLNPLAYGANGLMSGRAMTEFMSGRMTEAERFVEWALSGDDSHPSALMTGIATACALGKTDALAIRRKAFLAIYTEGLNSLAIRALPFEDTACRDRLFRAVQEGLSAT